MTTKDSSSIDVLCNHLNQLIGDVSAKNLFTGYGIFYKKIDMFAIWLNGKLYLRAEDELVQKLEDLGCTQFTSIDFNKRLILLDYYQLTERILADNKALRNLIYLSIIQVKNNRIDKELAKANRLKDLPNLTIKHERALKKVGINDVETLREHGAIQAMIMLKKAGIDATEDFYWKLVGALENRHFLSYSDEERQKKLDKFNECLAENGFRRCKKKKSKEDK